MSSRWSLSNQFQAISHEQAGNYVTAFKAAVEESFGTECALDIRILSVPKLYTTFLDDDVQSFLDETNKNNTILSTNNPAEVTPELWEQAGYVEVGVRPIDRTQAPEDYAFGHVEFKGQYPRQATFYVQPNGDDVKRAMLAQKSFTTAVGDGYTSNGLNSGFVPASVGKMFPSSLLNKMGLRPFG